MSGKSRAGNDVKAEPAMTGWIEPGATEKARYFMFL